VRQGVDIAEAQLRDYRERLGKPFEQEKYLAELTALRDRHKVGLSGTPKEGEPDAAELAEQIKALRATQVVEVAPQRTGKRQSSAEEPVTARIRRRVVDTGDEREWSAETEMAHRERIGRVKKWNARQGAIR
jgi:hypothetical protein